MVKRRVVRDVVVVLWVGRPRGRGLRLTDPPSWAHASGGGAAAAGRGLDSVQDVGLGKAVPHRLIGEVQVLLVGGPNPAGGGGVQRVGAAGRGGGGGGGAAKVTLTERGDPGAGAARQGGVTAIQDGLWTGGQGRNRGEGGLGGGGQK